MTPPGTIFVDMDGVLADFTTAVTAATGKPFESFRTAAEKEWRDTKLYNTPHFWSNIPLMHDAMYLWNYLRPFKPEILTAVPHGDKNGGQRNPRTTEFARTGKWEWIQEHLRIPYNRFHCILREHKREYATKVVEGHVVSNLLIDDYARNVQEFIANRGHAILHTSAANSINQLKALGYINTRWSL